MSFAQLPNFVAEQLYDFMIKHASHASLSGGVDWIKPDEGTDTFSSPTWPTASLKAATTAVICFADKMGVKEMPQKEHHFQESCT